MQKSKAPSGQRHRRSRSIIFLCSETGASTSIARILKIILPKAFKIFWATREDHNRKTSTEFERIMLGKTAPPEYGHLFFVKTHEKLPVSWTPPSTIDFELISLMFE